MQTVWTQVRLPFRKHMNLVYVFVEEVKDDKADDFVLISL